MALTDTFIKNLKPTDKPAGDKYPDGQGMYLLVKAAGKYWRMDYRHLGKRKTLALGVYPAVSLWEVVVDHRVPLWAGGSDEDDNKWLLCHPCHDAKTAREAAERARGG